MTYIAQLNSHVIAQLDMLETKIIGLCLLNNENNYFKFQRVKFIMN